MKPNLNKCLTKILLKDLLDHFQSRLHNLTKSRYSSFNSDILFRQTGLPQVGWFKIACTRYAHQSFVLGIPH